MDYNEHNNERSNEAEALFATKRKQQLAEEAERKRLEELERQKQQMAEEVKRLEALQAARREQEARLAQQTNEGPGTGAGPAGGQKGLNPKKKKLILIGALAGLAVAALAVVLILVLGSKSKPTDEPSGSRGVETTEEADLTLFYGMWKYDEYQNRYEINGDGTWTMYDGVGDETSSGVYRWEEGRLVLEDEDGNTAAALNLGTDDRLYDQDGDALSPYGEGSTEERSEDLSPFYGTWKYDEYENRYEIKEDGTWSIYVEEMGMVHAGSYDWEDGRLALTFDDGSFLTYLSLDTDDRLYDDDGNSLSRYDASFTRWFEDHGMLVNYQYGDPVKTVTSGFSLRGEETDAYTRIPAYWYVERSYRESTGDGNCVVTLVAGLTTVGNTMPAFTSKEKYWWDVSWAICDYYTGFYLPKSVPDTLYSYSYEANGETVHVEFSFTTEYTLADDKSYTYMIILTVRMPEDYDGLVLSCHDTSKSYEIFKQRRERFNRSDVFPLDEFPDWQDFASGLICKINE